jgi:hypothetical protein
MSLAVMSQSSLAAHEAVRNVVLFAISRSSVRTQGYGGGTDAPSLAMAV